MGGTPNTHLNAKRNEMSEGVNGVRNALGRDAPDKETVDQALAYRTALARRPDWDHPILTAVVEVCGNTGYNWFDLP